MIAPQTAFQDPDDVPYVEIRMSQTTHDIVVMFKEKVCLCLTFISLRHNSPVFRLYQNRI
jgi:hypothetical protein